MKETTIALDPNAEGVIVETLTGEQFVSSRPTVPYAKIASRLLTLVMGLYGLKQKGPGGWYFVFEPELHLGSRPGMQKLWVNGCYSGQCIVNIHEKF